MIKRLGLVELEALVIDDLVMIIAIVDMALVVVVVVLVLLAVGLALAIIMMIAPMLVPPLAMIRYAVLLSGSTFSISAPSGLCSICQRSQSCCRPSQRCALAPNNRSRRRAVSVVTLRWPWMISLSRGKEMPKRLATSVWVSL